jgi:hypothetical protein
MEFGWKHYYRPLPKPLQQLMVSAKMFIGAIAVSSYVADHETRAFWLLVAGAALDFILNFFAEAPVETLEKTAGRLKRDIPEVDVKVNITDKENGE